MRHTGIEAIGDVPWGTHFCQFYETDRDLIEMLVPYFKKGLEANELCMWVTSEPLQVRQAKAALKAAVPDLDRRLRHGQIEIIDYKKWYVRSGKFSAEEVLKGWADKLGAALGKRYEGLRLSGNTFWLEQADWEDFRRYEEAVNSVIGGRRMLALCTYSLQKCGASEIIDVVANHEFALIKRRGRWEIIESAARKQAEETLKKETLKYSKVLQTANAGFWVVDLEGKLIEVNDTYCLMSGYSRGELLSMRISDLEAKETPDEVRGHIRYLREHGHHQFESRHRRKDGTVFDAEIRASYLDIEGGRMVGFTWDISERKRIEEETRRLASFPMLNPQPVVEVDEAGRVRFANPAARKLFPDLQISGPDHPWLADWKTLAAHAFRRPAGNLPTREVRVGERWYHQSMYLVPETGRLRIYGFDITSRVLAEEDLRRLNRTLTALSHSDQAMMRAKNEKEFLEEACQIIVRDCGHAMVWIGYAEDDEEKSVLPMAFAGFEKGYVETLKISWADGERGHGPTGTAIRTGKPCACPNMLTDPQFAPWREQALARGYASSLVLPLLTDGGTFGAISIYFKQPGAVADDEMKLLTELANDVAYGISSIRLREAHARAEEALRQRTGDLQQLTETLEQRVGQRTAELADANELLQAEVTHSHFIEADLKSQKETLQTVIDNIPVMLCFFDSSGKAKLTNREFKRLLGWSKEEANKLAVIGAEPGKLGFPGSQGLEAGGIPGWHEHKIRTSAGEGIDSSWAAVRLSDGGQIGIGLDMRERREAERERLRLAAAVEQADRGMAIMDEAGLIIYANPAFEITSGLTRAELLGRRYYDLPAGEGADGLVGDVEKTVRGGGIWSGHSTRRTRNGQSRELEISVSPIRDLSGHIINSLVVERDITPEVRLQQRLRQAQKLEALGTLAGGIAHDFNNILNPIFINTELVLMDAALDDQSRLELELALKAAERGRDLVRQIITFSRQKEKERQPTQIAPVVKEALKFLRSTLPASIEIREHIGPETGFIMADPSQIHQIVMNLCNNSAYAMRERGGVLEVRLVEVQVDEEMVLRHPEIKPGPFLRLTVTDTGTGMTPEVVERVFDPFFTTKKPGEGSGMGLAVVHGIIRDYEGAVTVYSEVGQGTTFNIFFPRVPSEEIETQETVGILPRGRERILLVDDDEAQVQSMRNILKRLGHHVVSETDPKKALKAFKKDPAQFDLVITDQIMPGLTGAQLSEEILRLRPGLPVILCTGFSEKVDASGAQALGISGFLMKPFSIREMAAAIDQALKKD
ncbi:MAG: hypothetical protein A2W03_08495 [Candidatus Aminicenantes bacterium RBG_16_63_16]|nr:MAG: hypothetical protein A2W03_08495 [Candidatus Aminicenantes bacterium RBG_16_63_16]